MFITLDTQIAHNPKNEGKKASKDKGKNAAKTKKKGPAHRESLPISQKSQKSANAKCQASSDFHISYCRSPFQQFSSSATQWNR